MVCYFTQAPSKLPGPESPGVLIKIHTQSRAPRKSFLGIKARDLHFKQALESMRASTLQGFNKMSLNYICPLKRTLWLQSVNQLQVGKDN